MRVGLIVKDYYKILQVDPEANLEIINNAYRTLVRQCHPDLYHTSRKARMHERMLEINEAYHVLQDPQRRAHHDANRQNAATGRQVCELPIIQFQEGAKKILMAFAIVVVLLRFFIQPLLGAALMKVLLPFVIGAYLVYRFIGKRQKSMP
jgi:curved DNA-binding protein CbpA